MVVLLEAVPALSLCAINLLNTKFILYSAKMKITNDFLDKEDFEKIQNFFLSSDFPWYYNDHINYPGEDIGGFKQFTHMLYNNLRPTSFAYDNLDPILSKIKPFAIARIKANLVTKHTEVVEHGYHIDFTNAPTGSLTSILYLNDNDGYTKFKNGAKIESKANRLVTFDGNMAHTGTTTTFDRRVVLNINWFPVGPPRTVEGQLL